MIGIFWVYRDTVLGRARPLAEGEENIPGLLDSPDAHGDVWEAPTGPSRAFPELRALGYEQVPRGRVWYDTRRQRPIVYLDRVLLAAAHKTRIAAFFEFDPQAA
ncbi:MAG: hypothetical protein B7Z66_12160 [Chromatiales bacterium 21-64-14]|nr:MAG: hypothetical protein B7Z66_12160 [Chromatiales bacterium 21-64-14]